MSRRPTPLDNEQCRQCQPFKDYVKKSTKNKEGERDDSHKSVSTANTLYVWNFFIFFNSSIKLYNL